MVNVYSLSISAQLTLNMHSLNNEGGEGNQITTRMVNIVGEDRRLHNVNAISGDMFKHIQAEHLFRTLSVQQDVPLCAACRTFNANRISADEEYVKSIKDKSDSEAITLMLQSCALDDMEGNLITAGNRSVPRKSVVEFSWIVGLPEVTVTDSYFHVKYASDRSAAARESAKEEEGRKANLGQAIFHRPASSGVYALVASLEASRIGFNDISQTYAVDSEQRKKRYRALLESVLYSLIEPNGAMRATQSPHIVDLAGVVTLSTGVVPAPTVSPLNSGYREQIQGISRSLERVHPGAISLRVFDSLAEFGDVMTDIIESTEPYSLDFGNA